MEITMILLRTNRELRETFEKLIKTMKVQVKWTGVFAVIDNCIILQGEVRSLFFHFDSRKVVTNIIDIPVKEEDVRAAEGNTHVRNSINMILYVFGKWGAIEGLRVDKNYSQLNQLFTQIMREMQIEPEYTREHFRFYKNGIRITYEDVMWTALEMAEKPQEMKTEPDSQGLWHNIVWRRLMAPFEHVETTWAERRKTRLGNNFYMVGYLCPVCREKMHMAVYPMDKEFRIETEEGGVLLARTATCAHCNSFYTPRPRKMLSEGDAYTMQFGEDRKAYEDYLELLGREAERVSNCRCNEYADGHTPEPETDVSLEEFCENLSERSEDELRRMEELMEEGFYPDESIRRLERKIKEQIRRERPGKKQQKKEQKHQISKKEAEKELSPRRSRGAVGTKEREGREEKREDRLEEREGREEKTVKKDKPSKEVRSGLPKATEAKERREDTGRQKELDTELPMTKQSKLREKYEAKVKISERLSERQLREFRNEVSKDSELSAESRKEILEQIDRSIFDGRVKKLTEKVNAGEGKPYAVIRKICDEVEQEDIPWEHKEPLLARLRRWLQEKGADEVSRLMANMPATMNRAEYKKFREKIESYEETDLTPYREKLHESRERAERQELEEMVRRARKVSREDYRELAKRLRDGDFLPELILPYQEKIDAKIRQMDEEAIAELCPDPMVLSFEEGMEAYRKIEDGDFLPELKEDALSLLAKRLSGLKTDECELLVAKLRSELQEAGIAENEKHYFYPARRVLLAEALPEETEVIDYAMASYAAGRGPFEYPILVVDTTRIGTGKEGIILTPDHLYYSTLFSAYGISIPNIDRISASTGLLNRGVYVRQKNGTKIKIPCAVETKELSAFAGVLDEFIRYLQEKPESRELEYLAREKHETICCFRCGYQYVGGGDCPKCGYHNNS